MINLNVGGQKWSPTFTSIKIKYMNQKHELDFTIPIAALLLFIILAASSCTIYITPNQAANGKAKCGRGLR